MAKQPQRRQKEQHPLDRVQMSADSALEQWIARHGRREDSGLRVRARDRERHREAEKP